VIHLNTELLEDDIRMNLRDGQSAFLQVGLEVPCEYLFPILGNPHHVILMMIS